MIVDTIVRHEYRTLFAVSQNIIQLYLKKIHRQRFTQQSQRYE